MKGAKLAIGIWIAVMSWACEPTTLPEVVLDAEIDAEIDMEVDLGPSDCERACMAIARCAVSEDHCVGLSTNDATSVVDLCAPECAAKPALATVINGAQSCATTIAFFEGSSSEFQKLCNTPPGADAAQVDQGEADMGEPDMGEADMGEADMAADLGEADMGTEDMAADVESADAELDLGSDSNIEPDLGVDAQ